jgi:hypothetical protein
MLDDLFHDVVIRSGVCACHGELRQLDALLPDDTPVRILQSVYGFHVSVGDHALVPGPVQAGRVLSRVIYLWGKR